MANTLKRSKFDRGLLNMPLNEIMIMKTIGDLILINNRHLDLFNG